MKYKLNITVLVVTIVVIFCSLLLLTFQITIKCLRGAWAPVLRNFYRILWDDSPSGVGRLFHAVQPGAKGEQSAVQGPEVRRVLGGGRGVLRL